MQSMQVAARDFCKKNALSSFWTREKYAKTQSKKQQ